MTLPDVLLAPRHMTPPGVASRATLFNASCSGMFFRRRCPLCSPEAVGRACHHYAPPPALTVCHATSLAAIWPAPARRLYPIRRVRLRGALQCTGSSIPRQEGEHTRAHDLVRVSEVIEYQVVGRLNGSVNERATGLCDRRSREQRVWPPGQRKRHCQEV